MKQSFKTTTGQLLVYGIFCDSYYYFLIIFFFILISVTFYHNFTLNKNYKLKMDKCDKKISKMAAYGICKSKE